MTFSDDIKRVKEETPKSVDALNDYAQTVDSIMDYKDARIAALQEAYLEEQKERLKLEHKVIMLEMEVYQLKSNIS
jgi:hypothetical protein